MMKPTHDSKQEKTQKQPPGIAVVGAGIAGLSTAWHLSKLHPDLVIHVFEKASEESYVSGSPEGAKRASLGASPNRMIRQMGHDDTSRALIHQTFGMLKELQQTTDTPLVMPQASLYISDDKNTDEKYASNLKSLQTAGLLAGAGYAELKGAEVKKLYPGLFEKLPDHADVLMEAPFGQDPKSVSGAMDAQAITQTMIKELSKRGVQFHFATGIDHIDDIPQGGVALVTDQKQQYLFDKAVVAPGAAIGHFMQAEQMSNPVQSADEPSIANLQIKRKRVVIADVDVNKLLAGNAFNIAPNPMHGVPLYKGKGFENSYGWNSNSSDMHVKFYPPSLNRELTSDEELYAPVQADEMAEMIESVIEQFGMETLFPNVPKEQLQQRVAESMQAHTCHYTLPKGKNRQLVMPFRENSNIIMNGIDSSSSWRLAGQGFNAATQALELAAPKEIPDLHERYGFAAHREVTGQDKPVAQDTVDQRMNALEQRVSELEKQAHHHSTDQKVQPGSQVADLKHADTVQIDEPDKTIH